jgi:hypothetical protein
VPFGFEIAVTLDADAGDEIGFRSLGSALVGPPAEDLWQVHPALSISSHDAPRGGRGGHQREAMRQRGVLGFMNQGGLRSAIAMSRSAMSTV